MACGQFTNVTRQSGSWMRPVDSRLVGHTDYHACQDRLVAHWQQKGIIPRPCRLAVTTQRVHEPTHPCSSTSSTGPWPALDVLTTPQPVVVHHPAVCQMSQLVPEGSPLPCDTVLTEPSVSASRHLPRSTQRHPTRSCVRLLLLLQMEGEAETRPLFESCNATQPWRGPALSTDGLERRRCIC
jgi:hypothetical protein